MQQVGDRAAAFDAVKNAEEVASLEKLVETYGKGRVALVEYETAHQKAAADTQIIAAAFKQLNQAIADGISPLVAAVRVWGATQAAIISTNAYIDSQREKLVPLAQQYDALVAAKKRHNDTSKIEDQTMRDLNDQIYKGISLAE